jgi:hypothetical protein
MMDTDRRTHALVLVAVASCLSSLQADDGPRISTKKAAAVAPAVPRQTADDAQKSKKIAATGIGGALPRTWITTAER